MDVEKIRKAIEGAYTKDALDQEPDTAAKSLEKILQVYFPLQETAPEVRTALVAGLFSAESRGAMRNQADHLPDPVGEPKSGDRALASSLKYDTSAWSRPR